ELASIATSSLAINTDDLVEGSNLYFTNARADARIGAATSTIRGMFSASSPIFYNSFMGAFSIHQANVAQDGYLSSSDWNLFNNKVSSSSLSALLGDYLT